MKAHELLSDESKWTKGAYARNSHLRSVKSRGKAATCFCIIGAINRCYGNLSDYVNASSRLADAIPGRDAVAWNDNPIRTFAEVHDLLVKLDI